MNPLSEGEKPSWLLKIGATARVLLEKTFDPGFKRCEIIRFHKPNCRQIGDGNPFPGWRLNCFILQRLHHLVPDLGTAGPGCLRWKRIQGINLKTPKCLHPDIEGLGDSNVCRDFHAGEMEPGFGFKSEKLRRISAENDDPPNLELALDLIAHGLFRYKNSTACEKGMILQRLAKIAQICSCNGRGDSEQPDEFFHDLVVRGSLFHESKDHRTG